MTWSCKRFTGKSWKTSTGRTLRLRDKIGKSCEESMTSLMHLMTLVNHNSNEAGVSSSYCRSESSSTNHLQSIPKQANSMSKGSQRHRTRQTHRPIREWCLPMKSYTLAQVSQTMGTWCSPHLKLWMDPIPSKSDHTGLMAMTRCQTSRNKDLKSPTLSLGM